MPKLLLDDKHRLDLEREVEGEVERYRFEPIRSGLEFRIVHWTGAPEPTRRVWSPAEAQELLDVLRRARFKCKSTAI